MTQPIDATQAEFTLAGGRWSFATIGQALREGRIHLLFMLTIDDVHRIRNGLPACVSVG